MPKEFSDWEWDWNVEYSPKKREERYQAYLSSVNHEKAKKEFLNSHSPKAYSLNDSYYKNVVAYPTDFNRWSLYVQSSPAPEWWEGCWGEYFSFCVSKDAPSDDFVISEFHNWLENCE